MAAKKAKRERRPRQAFIPGAEPPSHPALDEAADEYHDLKTQRMDLTQQEAEAKGRVKELMVQHGLKKYTTASELEVVREHESLDTISVRPKKKIVVDVSENGEAE